MAGKVRERSATAFPICYMTKLSPRAKVALSQLKEMRAAIEEANTTLPTRPKGAFSVSEHVAHTGSAKTTARERLEWLVDNGLYEKMRVRSFNEIGRITVKTMYRKKAS